MSVSTTASAAGLLLIVLGVWLLLQTLVGNLPTRILQLNAGAKPVGVAGTAGQGATAGAEAAMGNTGGYTGGLFGAQGTAGQGATAGAEAAMAQLSPTQQHGGGQKTVGALA